MQGLQKIPTYNILQHFMLPYNALKVIKHAPHDMEVAYPRNTNKGIT